MIQLAQGFFRKTVFKTIRYFKHPRKLKNSRVLRWFSRHFLDKRVWKPTQHTLAAGVAIGMLIMMQLAPGQMLVAAALAAIFRVNIPIAIITCWISNPFTFVPFGLFQKWLGDHVMPFLPGFVQQGAHSFVNWLIANLHRLPSRIRDFIGDDLLAKGAEFITSMYVGGLFGGIVLGIISYPVVWVIWEGVARWNAARRARHRRTEQPSSSTQPSEPLK